jgi:hypothetical protein
MTEPPGLRDEPSLLGCAARMGCVLLLVFGVASLWFYWSYTQSMRGPTAVDVATSWTAHDIVLSAAQPAVRGTITFGDVDSPSSPVLGVTVGVPHDAASPDPSGAPGELLAVPAVRLTIPNAVGGAQSCIAPCELPLSACGRNCTATYDVTVELVTVGQARRRVAVTVYGGASAPVGGRLPSSTFTLVTTTPLPSGGS